MYSTNSMALGSVGNLLTGSIVAFIIAVVATVVIFVVFMKPSHAAAYHGFLKALYEFLDFRQYWLGRILKVLYTFTAVFCIVSGIVTMFSSFLAGLLMMVLGPIIARIAYEMILLLFSIHQEVSELNDKFEDGAPAPRQPAPPVPPMQPRQTPYAPVEPMQRAQQPAQPMQPPQPAQPAQPMQQTGRRPRQPAPAPVSWQPAQPPTPQSQFSGRYAPVEDNPYRRQPRTHRAEDEK